ncbi:hypothetical protein IHQ71_12075 [Rhizobium sp. TH2]|uniref:hypothetical protein n=1 Tax=Rhizobium sp. TH2 TaxID=2775403 RepID=UPI0021575D6B|nr:hypothetical protein [Rhizobium sp. TH2]UVC11242.1 hypothetical protein IHQ71_12075 [Rhizobium sp. TH2]
MDNIVVGLVLMAVIAAVIGYFFFKASKAKRDHGSHTSGDPGGDGRGWDYSHADGGADGGD